MKYSIILDEAALRECVESNLYQSSHFEVGRALAAVLSGDQQITHISPRLSATWHKNTLYLLQSRIETGYLALNSEIFEGLPQVVTRTAPFDNLLTIFQRVCRFALKLWNRLSLSSPVEVWSARTGYGIVFPFPKSKHTGFRVAIREGYDDRRVKARHGQRHLYAFASGVSDSFDATSEHERIYKRAFEGLQGVRAGLTAPFEQIEKIPDDTGSHSLTLNSAFQSAIKFQLYDKWIDRLTTEQKAFVTSLTSLPQRVEGPAGTGKTLCLLLRAFFLCKTAEDRNEECKILFIAHSDATKNAIAIQFGALGNPFYVRNKSEFRQAIDLKTLQEWCGELLGERDISSAQYLDQDALAAKELRKLLIKDVITERTSSDPGSLKYLSDRCRTFFESESSDYIAELLQHEIAIMIKGRASERIDSYLGLPYLAYGLPAKEENDRRFVFSLYKSYQQILNASGVFDTDDIVLTALGRLDTPIWRRRRKTEGYNSVVIDETHLFNLNELSIFHFLLQDPDNPKIIFSIDRSQAPGERGITTRFVKEVLTGSEIAEEATSTKLVFRSSHEIVRLAEAITSAGATLFTTFENPLIDVYPIMPASDETASRPPVYWGCENDQTMFSWVTERVKALTNELKCPGSDILVVCMTEKLLPALKETFLRAGRKFVELIHRGDLETVQRGQREGALILAHPDYVGGLEFKAVLILGVDEGRVPPSDGAVREESLHFLQFKSCNRLYVAVSRARFVVELFYSLERGTSPLLNHAVAIGAIDIKNSPEERGKNHES